MTEFGASRTLDPSTTDARAQGDRFPLPLDAWYVAAGSAEFGDGPIARRVQDQPIVLFRDSNRVPAALLNRCPHRGVALSLGQISDGRLACAYHGWRFNPDGACAHIPSLTQGREIASGVRVSGFPCREHDGLVWVWTGSGRPSTIPPSIPDYAGRVWTQGAIDLACEAMMPIENNLDICHPYFTHPRLHPQWFAIERAGFRELSYEVSLTATGMEVTSQGVRLAFHLPDRVTIEGGPDAPLIVLHHTPTAPARCRQHWLVGLKAASAEAQPGTSWCAEAPEIFEQDRRVMESAQLAYTVDGGAFERSVEADAPTLLARRIVRIAAAGRWPQDRARLARRRSVLVRG